MLTVEEVADYFDAEHGIEAECALFDRLDAEVGFDQASFIWLQACNLYDERHADDPCPRCGGDHDRIDSREPCPEPADVPPGLTSEDMLRLMPPGS